MASLKEIIKESLDSFVAPATQAIENLVDFFRYGISDRVSDFCDGMLAKNASKEKPKRIGWISVLVLVLATAYIVNSCGAGDNNDPSTAILMVKDGSLGQYTDVTVRDLLYSHYGSVYDVERWDGGETDDGRVIVEVSYYNENDTENRMVIQFEVLQEECFKVITFIDPSVDIEYETDVFAILNYYYLTWKNQRYSGILEYDPQLIQSLNDIPASDVAYGASATYSGNRSAIHTMFGEGQLDISVSLLLDYYDLVDLDLYCTLDDDNSNSEQTLDTVATEDSGAYDDLLGTYYFGDGYTVEIRVAEMDPSKQYDFTVIFDLASNDYVTGSMNLEESYSFDGYTANDEGKLSFYLDRGQLYLSFESRKHGFFVKELHRQPVIDYSSYYPGDYEGTYYSPSGMYSITLTGETDSVFYIELEYATGLNDSGYGKFGKETRLDGGAQITVYPMENNSVRVQLYSAISANGNFDEKLSRNEESLDSSELPYIPGEQLYNTVLQVTTENIESIINTQPKDIQALKDEYSFLLNLRLGEYIFKASAYGYFTGDYETPQFDYLIEACNEIVGEMKRYLPEDEVDGIYLYYALQHYATFDESAFDFESFLIGSRKSPAIDDMWYNVFETIIYSE